MKFRIKEVKPSGPFKSKFYPQIKEFWWWNNIGDNTAFVNSCHNSNKNFNSYKKDCFGDEQVYVDTIYEGEDIIREYKNFLNYQRPYEKIHEIS